jgi:L-alanine-DL-glutamate epimerase-like enolase superfamily enzyme
LPQSDTSITRIKVSAYNIPTEFPETDGTYAWESTTLVVVELETPEQKGLGYTYADTATAELIKEKLCPVIQGRNAMAIPECWHAMQCAIRNLGRPGIASMGIAATDAALWDLKARILNIPLVTLVGAAHSGVPVYGSGGFTSYSDQQLEYQLKNWIEQEISCVKIKIGRDPGKDLHRVKIARKAIRPETGLFVDANGAYSVKQAQKFAEAFAEWKVQWFEEPVSSDNLNGLHYLKQHAPPNMDITAGEYGYDIFYFQRMLHHQSVDVLQADASRCGITGLRQVDALCQAYSIPLSAHCAPSLHLHPGCSLLTLRHLEYFYDHARIEHMLFDGAPIPVKGMLFPDLTRAGNGLEFKKADAAKFAV